MEGGNHPRVYIATDVRLAVSDRGDVRAGHNAAEYAAWAPFAAAFGRVTIVGRTGRLTAGDNPVTGPGVEALLVRGYSGLLGLAVALPTLRRQFRDLGDGSTIFIGRPPEPLSLLLYLRARAVGARFVSVVASEPEQLMRAVIPGPAGWMLGRIAGDVVRRIVRRSAAVVYVTQEWLQSIYPAAAGAPTLARSNVVFDAEDFVPHPLERSHRAPALSVVSLGNVNSRAKGADDLIAVITRLRNQGHPATLRVIGGGSQLDRLRAIVQRDGLAGCVTFEGHVSSKRRIRQLLDEADIYLTMSRAEGLSRATIEAMARGLPVVSTRAGGVAELVRPQQLVALGDVDAATRIVASIVTDDDEYRAASAASLRSAREVASTSDPRRLTEFLSALL